MRLSGTTTMLGLIGTPVEHSKSPAMYNCFAKYGLDWAYLAFDISPEKAGDAVQAIRTLHIRGANVTMPCKNAVIPYLDELTPAARAIQRRTPSSTTTAAWWGTTPTAATSCPTPPGWAWPPMKTSATSRTCPGSAGTWW